MNKLNRLLNSSSVIIRHNITRKTHLVYDDNYRYKKILIQLYKDHTKLKFKDIRNINEPISFILEPYMSFKKYDFLADPIYLSASEILELFIPDTLLTKQFMEDVRNVIESKLSYPDGVSPIECLGYGVNEFVFNLEGCEPNNDWLIKETRLMIENFERNGVLIPSGSGFIDAGEVPEPAPQLTENELINLGGSVLKLVKDYNIKHITK